MSNVKIVPSKDGKLVTAYEGNAEFGYILLAQTTSVMDKGWLRDTTNRTIIKGAISALEGFVNGTPGLVLEGNLVVNEYTEDAVPEAIANANFDKNKTVEDQIAGYIKRAGKDGPALTSEGRKILRFVSWDATAKEHSVKIQHDNIAEVTAFNASKAEASADLPS